MHLDYSIGLSHYHHHVACLMDISMSYHHARRLCAR